MDVVIKWENLEGQKFYNDKLIDLAKEYQANDKLSKFNFLVSREPNSRYLIKLMINTQNEGEELNLLSNSFNFENSLYLLKKDLSKTIGRYNHKQYLIMKEKEKELQEKIEKERQKELEEKKRKAKELESSEKNSKLAKEKAKAEEDRKRNEAILKKLEKKKKRNKKEDDDIIEALEKQKLELDEAVKIQKENKRKLREHMATLKFDVIADDLEEDREIQEKIKDDKKKLKDLQSEENECLVIIEEIKEVEKKLFDTDEFVVNEPFSLGGAWFYYDDAHKIYITNEENEWVEISPQDVQPYYDAEKAPILEELEYRLIEARRRRKLHLKDMADGKELIAELEASKNRRKRLEKQQKENFNKLKANYEEFAKQNANEVKAHINPVNIDIAETHPANEAFLSENNQWAYHDGEGRYYVADAAGNWYETTKENIYKKSDLITTSIESVHSSGDVFKNAKGESCYFDGTTYYKLADGAWQPISYAEANDMDVTATSTLKKRKMSKEEKKQQKLEKKNSKNNEAQSADASFNNAATYGERADAYQQNSQVTYTEDGGQQWQDENGTWWYLDASGNYYYSDGTNWIPYSS